MTTITYYTKETLPEGWEKTLDKMESYEKISGTKYFPDITFKVYRNIYQEYEWSINYHSIRVVGQFMFPTVLEAIEKMNKYYCKLNLPYRI